MASYGRDGDGERQIGVAMDYSASSYRALEWAVRNLLCRGDTLVVLIVHQPGRDEAKRAALWADSGTPLIPLSEFCEPAVMQTYGMRSIYARHHRAPARGIVAACASSLKDSMLAPPRDYSIRSNASSRMFCDILSSASLMLV